MLSRIITALLSSLSLGLRPLESDTSEIVANRGQKILATLSNEGAQNGGVSRTPLCVSNQTAVPPPKTREFRNETYVDLRTDE